MKENAVVTLTSIFPMLMVTYDKIVFRLADMRYIQFCTNFNEPPSQHWRVLHVTA